MPELQDIEKDVTQLLQETFSETTVHLKAELPDVKRLLADIDVDTRALLYEPELLKIFNTFVGKALKR